MRSIRKSVTFVLSVSLLTLLVFPVAAQVSRVTGPDCGFLGLSCTGGETIEGNVNPVLVAVFNAGIFLLGSIAAIFILYAGFKYITSGGDEQKARTAKLQILFAFIGIIIVVTAAVIKKAIETLGFLSVTEGPVTAGETAAGKIAPIILSVSNFASLLVGTIATVFLLYAGFKYITSQGEAEAAATAKRQIAYAVIGIIITVLVNFGIASALKDFVVTQPENVAAIITSTLDPYILLALRLVQYAAIIFLVYAGFRYISSSGDPEAGATAKRQIIYAVVGLLIAGLAEAIQRAVITRNIATPDRTGLSLLGGLTSSIYAFLGLASITAVIYMILAGVMYITSTGDEEQAQRARKQIIYAVIGIVVILLSIVIVNFVGSALFVV